MALTIPSNAQTFSVSMAKTIEGWFFTPSYWYINSAGATEEWSFGSGAIPSGWMVYRVRAWINTGNQPGQTLRSRLLNTGSQIGSDVVTPSGAGWDGATNHINYLNDTGLVDVHASSPIPLSALSLVRFRLICDSSIPQFAYHADTLPGAQVVAAPARSRPVMIL